MPVFTAAAAFIGSTLVAVGVATTAATIIGTVVSSLATSLVLGAVSRALSPKPRASSVTATLRDRTVNVRQPIAARRIVYGRVKLGGPLLFVHATDNNSHLHLIVALAGHEVADIGAVYFNDELVAVNSDGSVSGRYAGFAFVHKHLGSPDQAADSGLMAAAPDQWTSAHRLRGIAYLYVKLVFDQNLFGANGVPNISAIVGGRKVFDPRNGLTTWSDNPALCLADYLSDTKYGLGAGYATEIDEGALIAAANACDEQVNLAALDVSASADPESDVITLGSGAARLLTGTRLRFATTGALPGGLAAGTDYYWIGVTATSGKIATSLANARSAISVDLTSPGGGDHTASRQAEPRFTANGTIESDRTPKDNIQELLTAKGGFLVFAGGKWGIHPAVYRLPVVNLTESDLRAPFRVQSLISRRENFNAVKGVFVDPASAWQPTDFPPVTNASYLAEDGAERAWRDVSLPFTISSSTAQRLAKIELARARQPITLSLPCKLTAFRLGVPDVVNVSNARMGWAAKPFEVRGWTFALYEDGHGPSALGVDLQLRETAAAVFDWASGEETRLDPAPNTNLPDPFTVSAPGAPQLTEVLYATRDGAGVKARAALTWAPSADAFLSQYQVDYKNIAAPAWTFAGRTVAPELDIFDMVPGAYDFRVRAINQIGVSSAYAVATNRQIYGLLAPPTAPQNMTISAIGGLAIIRWDQSPDLDVRIGGRLEFRHSPESAAATWPASTSIGEAIPGGDTVAILPLKAGTYLAKTVDSSGIASLAAASVATKQASVLNFANVAVIAEHPGFAGTHTDTVGMSGILKLNGVSAIDSWTAVDAVLNWDAEGGIRPSGDYIFAAGLDRGSVARIRITAALGASAFNVLDQFDSRTDNINTWQDFDGPNAGAADARLYVRQTDDDPNVSPAWGPWNRLDSAEFAARAFQFRCRLTSSDPTYNAHVTALSVIADQVV